MCVILFNSLNAKVLVCFVRETASFSISISDICYSNDVFYSFNVKTTNGYYFPVQFWVVLFWFILKHFFRTFLVFFLGRQWDCFYRLHIAAIFKNGLSALVSWTPVWLEFCDRQHVPDMWPQRYFNVNELYSGSEVVGLAGKINVHQQRIFLTTIRNLSC